MSEQSKAVLKPVIILPPNEMHNDSIKKLREVGYCVVTAKHPESIRFLEPPPTGYSDAEKACIKLCRIIFAPKNKDTSFTTKWAAQQWVDLIVSGTSLDSKRAEKIAAQQKAAEKPQP